MSRAADRARWAELEHREKLAELADSLAATNRADARRGWCFEQLAFWLSPWQVAGHPGESDR